MRTAKIHIVVLTGILLLAPLCAYPAHRYRGSARNEVKHYARLSADIAYARGMSRAGEVWDMSSLSLDEARSLVGSGLMEAGLSGNGFAPSLGIGYRMTYSWLRLDVGLGAEYRRCSMQPHNMLDITGPGVDEEGMKYTGHHSWSNRRCVLQHAGVTLPVMIGGEWEKVCVMAGVKASIDVWGTSEEKGNYSLEAEYDRYFDNFHDMPNHGFVTDEPYSCGTQAQSAAWNLRACLEVGYCVYGGEQSRYRRKESMKVYVSAFGEYGITGSAKAYTPLLLGVRATMLIPLPKEEKCTTCWRY